MVVSFKYSTNDIFSLYPEYGCFFNDLNLILPSFIVFILKKWYHNEKQPSKADVKTNVIYLKKKQMKNKDIGARLIHEIAHLYFNTNRGAFFNKPYPMNIEEEFLKYIISDLISNYEFQKELEKNKPNFDKLASLSKRYFNPDLFATIEIN